MQTQDVSTEFMFKFWPWLEANRKRLIIGAVAVVVFFFGWFYFSTARQQKELDAGHAYTAFQLNQPPASTPQTVAAGYLQMAERFAGTLAGQRARLQSALILFGAGDYTNALTRFQDFLTVESGSPLTAQAQLGVAASLEAQGRLDEAQAAYRKVSPGNPNAPEAIMAKFAQGRILELQGKLNDAVTLYQDIASSPLAGSLASEAAQRIALMQTKLAATQPAVVKPVETKPAEAKPAEAQPATNQPATNQPAAKP